MRQREFPPQKPPKSTTILLNRMVSMLFLVVDTQLYKRLCPFVRPSIRPSVRNDRIEKWKNKHFEYFLRMFVCGVGVWVWIWVGCPPARHDIVTPRHLLVTNLLAESNHASFPPASPSCVVLTDHYMLNVCVSLSEVSCFKSRARELYLVN